MAEPCKEIEDNRLSPRTYGDLWSPRMYPAIKLVKLNTSPDSPDFH